MTGETYNKKGFLVEDSIRSMASYHAKIYDNGKYRLRIHDCITGIRLLGDLNNPEEVQEAITKLNTLEKAVNEFRVFIEKNYGQAHCHTDSRD